MFFKWVLVLYLKKTKTNELNQAVHRLWYVGLSTYMYPIY